MDDTVMSNDKNKRQTSVKSKLFKLKEWLTVPDAAKYLSTIFGEEVSEADVLRLALDRHLKLSVNFVNHADAIRGNNFLPFKEWEENLRSAWSWENLKTIIGYKNMLGFHHSKYDFVYYPGKEHELTGPDTWDKVKLEKLKMDFLGEISTERQSFILSSIIEEAFDDHKKNLAKFGGKVPPSAASFRGEVKTLTGVWDLPLLGCEQIDIEYKYQQLTDGPEVTLTYIDGTFVERQDGQAWQLQEKFDKEYLEILHSEERIKESLDYYADVLKKKISNNEINEEDAGKLLGQRKQNLNRPRNRSDDYYPAGGLPSDSVLVVRTSALLDLQERVSEEQAEGKPISPRTEKSNLHIIGALLQVVMDEKLFSSEEALREHLAAQYQGYPGCAERTLAGRFAEAKKLLSE
jgi:hypothetical protein